jgi:DNA-binding transcriptional MerR regulator
VARQTGVNAITLRAWERRYGLIVPQRTPKGHRLFSSEHVQRILTILTWLNRGVAVSQVKPLLDTPQAFTRRWRTTGNDSVRPCSAPSSSSMSAISTTASTRPWPCIRRAPVRAIADAAAHRTGTALARPVRCADGACVFYSWLRSKFGARIYHNNRQLHTAPLLLINHSDLPWNLTCGSARG